jgi:DNA-binding HxlR family transcriptional regulator
MNQFDRFQPVSRNQDPETSHQAELELTVLGKRAVRCRQVLRLIADNNGSTTGELARYMHHKHPELPIACSVESPHKRVSDLEEKGLVRRGESRVCLDSGRERIAWYVTDLGVKEIG